MPLLQCPLFYPIYIPNRKITMSNFLKILMTGAVLLLTLSACKPGVYADFSPQARAEAAKAANQAAVPAAKGKGSVQTAAAAPAVKAPIPGEKINMIVPG